MLKEKVVSRGKEKGVLSKLPIKGSFKKYLTNIWWLLFDKFFTLGVAFFVGVYVARYLGPENYGIISFALSLIAFLAVFTGLGIKNIVTRNLVKEEDKKDTILGTAFVLELAAAILGIIMLYGFSYFSGMDEKAFLILSIISLKILLAPFQLVNSYFESRVLAKKTVPIFISKTAISSLAKVYLVYTEQSLEWFAVAYVLESLVGAVGILWVYYRNGFSLLSWKFDKFYGKELLSDSWPYLLSGFVIVVYLKIDAVMIKYLIGDAAVGIYAVAGKFTSIWYFAGGIIAKTLLPSIIKTREKDNELYEKRLQYLCDLMVYVGLSIALPMTFLSGFIINFLYGADFAESASVLMIQVWSLLFIFLGNAASKWYLVENLQKSNLVRTIAGAIVNVTLNLILIPVYGIQGAAVATLVAQAVASCFGNYIGIRTRKIFWMQINSLTFLSIIRSKPKDNVFYFLKSQLTKS